MNFIPSAPGTTPSYFCTWATQNAYGRLKHAEPENPAHFFGGKGARLKHVVLSEDSNAYSERIQAFSVYAKLGPLYLRVGRAQSAGNKTIVKLSPLTPWTKAYRVVIEQAKANPILRYIGLYK